MTSNYQVQSSDNLYRWLHPGQFKWDERRPTSAAFRDPYMSVDVAGLTTLAESYERARKAKKDAVASFAAQVAFEKAQEVYHCPTQVCASSEESVCVTDEKCPAYKSDGLSRKLNCTNAAHGCVIGNKPNSVAKSFSKACKVEIYPPEQNSLI
jgi:hypothetical protein